MYVKCKVCGKKMDSIPSVDYQICDSCREDFEEDLARVDLSNIITRLGLEWVIRELNDNYIIK